MEINTFKVILNHKYMSFLSVLDEFGLEACLQCALSSEAWLTDMKVRSIGGEREIRTDESLHSDFLTTMSCLAAQKEVLPIDAYLSSIQL